MSKTNKELLEFGSKKITHNYAEAQFSFLEEFNKEPKFRLTLIGLNKETSERVWDFILKEINQEPILLSRGSVMDVEVTINSFEKIYKSSVVGSSKTSQLTVFDRADETKKAKSMHGLYRKLLSNMVHGVKHGFTKVLDSGETNFWGRDKSL